MNLSKKIMCLAACLGAVPLAAVAGEMGTVSTQIGTGGIGIGYAASVSEDWAVRGQYNAFPKKAFTGNVGDFGTNSNLTIEIDWSSVQLTGDWYPSAGGFRMSGGLVLNNNKVTVVGSGNVNNKPATVNAEIKMSNGLTPYVGIGYSIRPKEAKGFGFTYDLGAMFQNPKSTLTASGVGISQADIDAQNAIVQDAIDKLKVMPVFNIGITYSF
jgi:hypothetical protein